jgi:hypothetical protein
MKYISLLVWGFVLAPWAWSQASLGASEELALNPPWQTPLALMFPQPGTYRLEATGLAGDPVEVVIERKVGEGTWRPEGTNRTMKGALEAMVEWSVEDGDFWRVRPAAPVRQTVVLRLKKAAFTALKNSLKQDLTAGPEVSLPLKKRFELPVGTGGPGLTAVSSPRGELWIGWLLAQGTAAEVWTSTTRNRLGTPVAATVGPWTGLSLGGSEGPVLTARRGTETEARAWTGLDWAVEAAPTGQGLTTSQGTFRYESVPVPRVWRATAGGWADLELPRNRMLDRLLLGSTADSLYAFLGSSTGRERELYAWAAGTGWTAMAPPPAAGPPQPGQWSVTSGAGTLYQVEGRGTEARLLAFDGTGWDPGLDLSVLVGKGLEGAVLLPPSPWSKTGTLVLATDRVTVYDLP